MGMCSSDPAVAKQQMLAIVFLLTAFGHMDGKFAMSEKRFVQEKIARLVEDRMLEAVADPLARQVATARVTGQFQRVAAAIDREIAALFTESVAEGETTEQFVYAKLALRCYELLHPFDDEARANLFAIVDELIEADGAVHANEARLRDDIQRLLAAPIDIELEEAPDTVFDRRPEPLEIEKVQTLVARADDHPFFTREERAYARDRASFDRSAGQDLELLRKFRSTLEQQRAAGAGKLAGRQTLRGLRRSGALSRRARPTSCRRPPPRGTSSLVLGDLHGCYSCLKAALMQTDFLAKVQAHADDPDGTPDTRLVLLGDYIDRGGSATTAFFAWRCGCTSRCPTPCTSCGATTSTTWSTRAHPRAGAPGRGDDEPVGSGRRRLLSRVHAAVRGDAERRSPSIGSSSSTRASPARPRSPRSGRTSRRSTIPTCASR